MTSTRTPATWTIVVAAGSGSRFGGEVPKQFRVVAGRRIVDLARRYYEQDDDCVLPRSIACFDAFENAMTLDIAMGGSTNTILHILAAAVEAGIDFTMKDIDT